MTQCLSLLDIDQIKGYIFASPFLREMRGASSIIARFNDEVEVRRRVESLGGKLIYAGGGSVLSEFSSESIARSFLAHEKNLLRQVTESATLTGVVHEYDGRDFGEVISSAQRKLRRAKVQRGETEQLTSGDLIKPCDLCKELPAIIINQERDFICAACQKRSNTNIHNWQFYNQFKNGFKNETWRLSRQAKDLAELTASSNNYLGFIQADGNSMGQRLAGIRDEELFKSFSEAVNSATEGSLLEALQVEYPEPRYAKEASIYPFEIFILGGDDVILITTADKAIPVALRLCQNFARRMETFADINQNQTSDVDLRVAMSAGVVFARSNYPIYFINELAEQLLKSAKSYSKKCSSKSLEITLDFMTITESAGVDLPKARKLYPSPTHGRLRLTQRPYKSTKLIDLLRTLHKIKFPQNDAPAFPRNKLHELYEIPFRGKTQGTFDYLTLRSRLSEEHQKLLDEITQIGGMEVSPWHEVAEHDIRFDTLLTDIVELYKFLPKDLRNFQGG